MNKHPLIWLVLCGCFLTFIFVRIHFLSFQFEYVLSGVPDVYASLQARPILLMLGLFGIAFAIYLLAIYLSRQLKSPSEKRFGFLTMILFAIVFRFILVFSVPIQEIDIYRYIWDGNVVANGQSPYQFSPLQIRNQQQTDDPRLLALRQLRQRDKGLRDVVDRIHFEQLPTIYPPVSQAVFALSAKTTPRGTDQYWRIVNMKAWLILFDLLTLAAIIALLKICGRSRSDSIVYAWCPLVMKEIANGGHLDSIAVFFCVASVAIFLFGLKQETRARQTLFLIVAGSVLSLGIGAKLFPAVILPCFFIASIYKIGWLRTLAINLWVGIFSGLLLWPLLFGKPVELQTVATPQTPVAQDDFGAPAANSAFQDDGKVAAVDPSAGLMTFATSFEINDWLFMLVYENIKPAADVPRANQVWFSVVPESLKTQLIQPLAVRFNITEQQAAFMAARLFALIVLTMIIGWLCLRMDPHDSQSIARVVFLSIAWFWLVSPTQNPWYWCWCLPFLPFVRQRAWYLLSGCVLIYYLRFWLTYHFPVQALWPVNQMVPLEQVSPIRLYAGDNFFNFVVTWLEFGPWFILLLVESVIRRKSLADQDTNEARDI